MKVDHVLVCARACTCVRVHVHVRVCVCVRARARMVVPSDFTVGFLYFFCNSYY